MRVVIASCSVTYEGRLAASLPEATRLIMIKADGCVAIHADGGAYKPLNWMNAPNTFEELADRLIVRNPKGETLTIQLHRVFSDVSHELGEDPGLTKDGVEADLQVLLAAMPETIEPGLTLIRREYPTAVGPVDLLCRDAAGQPWLLRLNVVAKSMASSNSRVISIACTPIRRSAKFEAFLSRNQSSRKRGCLLKVETSVGAKSITTNFAAKKPTS